MDNFVYNDNHIQRTSASPQKLVFKISDPLPICVGHTLDQMIKMLVYATVSATASNDSAFEYLRFNNYRHFDTWIKKTKAENMSKIFSEAYLHSQKLDRKLAIYTGQNVNSAIDTLLYASYQHYGDRAQAASVLKVDVTFFSELVEGLEKNPPEIFFQNLEESDVRNTFEDLSIQPNIGQIANLEHDKLYNIRYQELLLSLPKKTSLDEAIRTVVQCVYKKHSRDSYLSAKELGISETELRKFLPAEFNHNLSAKYENFYRILSSFKVNLNDFKCAFSSKLDLPETISDQIQYLNNFVTDRLRSCDSEVERIALKLMQEQKFPLNLKSVSSSLEKRLLLANMLMSNSNDQLAENLGISTIALSEYLKIFDLKSNHGFHDAYDEYADLFLNLCIESLQYEYLTLPLKCKIDSAKAQIIETRLERGESIGFLAHSLEVKLPVLQNFIEQKKILTSIYIEDATAIDVPEAEDLITTTDKYRLCSSAALLNLSVSDLVTSLFSLSKRCEGTEILSLVELPNEETLHEFANLWLKGYLPVPYSASWNEVQKMLILSALNIYRSFEIVANKLDVGLRTLNNYLREGEIEAPIKWATRNYDPMAALLDCFPADLNSDYYIIPAITKLDHAKWECLKILHKRHSSTEVVSNILKIAPRTMRDLAIRNNSSIRSMHQKSDRQFNELVELSDGLTFTGLQKIYNASSVEILKALFEQKLKPAVDNKYSLLVEDAILSPEDRILNERATTWLNGDLLYPLEETTFSDLKNIFIYSAFLNFNQISDACAALNICERSFNSHLNKLGVKGRITSGTKSEFVTSCFQAILNFLSKDIKGLSVGLQLNLNLEEMKRQAVLNLRHSKSRTESKIADILDISVRSMFDI